MSAPRPNGGATSSKPKNPGPQPVGQFGPKTYPKPTRTFPGLGAETVARVGTVTKVVSRPWAFQVTSGGDGHLEYPTERAEHELDVPKGDLSPTLGQQYWVFFRRPLGSSDLTPYVFDAVRPR